MGVMKRAVELNVGARPPSRKDRGPGLRDVDLCHRHRPEVAHL